MGDSLLIPDDIPGIGREAGASLYSLQEMYQGFFLAPHVVSQALKGAVFTARFLEKLGFRSNPSWDAKRTDLIQSVEFTGPEQMIAFCQAIQYASPSQRPCHAVSELYAGI
ncbi:methionine gamma-lyase family protein [Bacillus sonorensis]|nr:methionine gamma-lyase family protein [Bacillus sonorensis]